MAPDDIRYDSIKEPRDWYYVEYSPPFPGVHFSMLNLTIEQEAGATKVAAAMEIEAREWIARYPVPVMVSAFSLDEDRISLDGVREDDCLMAWPSENGYELHWRIFRDGELPTVASDRGLMRQLFAGVPHRTGTQILSDYVRHKKQMKTGWWLVFAWAVVVPLVVAVLEWWSDLLGLAVLAFAFIKALVKAMQLTGRWPKSERQKGKDAQELKMRHHHYHCERNPEGFERLKAENSRRQAEERSRAEAAKLRASLKVSAERPKDSGEVGGASDVA